MLADEENRKLFSEIAQELEKPLKEFSTKLAKDMADIGKSITNTTKTGVKLYAGDVDDFIVNTFSLLEAQGSEAINNISNYIADKAIVSVKNLANSLVDVEEVLRRTPTETIKVLRGEMDKVAQIAKNKLVGFFSFESIYNNISAAISYASKIGDLAKSLDVNTESFSHWADVVTATGGDADTFASSIGNLKDHLDKAGSSKDVFSYLLELSGQMQSMSSKEANALGKSLNIDPKTISLLKQGSASLQEMLSEQQKLGGVTGGDKATIDAFNKAMNAFNHVIRTVALDIGTTILPALTWFLEKVQVVIHYLSENKDFVKGFFIGISAVLLTIFLPALWTAFAPLLPIIAIILVLGTICGTIFSYVSKRINETGGWIEKLRNGISNFIESAINLFVSLGETVGAIFDVISGIFSNFISIIVEYLGLLFTEGPIVAVGYLADTIVNGLNTLIQMIWDWIKNVGPRIWEGIKGWFGGGSTTTDKVEDITPEQVKKAMGKGSDSMNAAQQSSQLLASSNGKTAISNNQQVSYRNNFNITSNNPEEVGRIVDQKMRSMNQDAGEYFNDGRLA